MGTARRRNVAKIQTDYVQMQDFTDAAAAKKRKRLFRRLSSFFALATVISYFMISSILSQASALDEKKDLKNQLKKELTSLERDESILKEEVIKLNDDEYIAKLARKEYFLSEKNEIIFTIPEGKKKK